MALGKHNQSYRKSRLFCVCSNVIERSVASFFVCLILICLGCTPYFHCANLLYVIVQILHSFLDVLDNTWGSAALL